MFFSRLRTGFPFFGSWYHPLKQRESGNQCSPVILHGVPVTMILSDLVPSACPVTIHLTNLSEKRDCWGFRKIGGPGGSGPKVLQILICSGNYSGEMEQWPPHFLGKQHFPRQESSNLSDFGNSCWYSQVNPGNVGITGNEIQPLVGRSQEDREAVAAKYPHHLILQIWINMSQCGIQALFSKMFKDFGIKI